MKKILFFVAIVIAVVCSSCSTSTELLNFTAYYTTKVEKTPIYGISTVKHTIQIGYDSTVSVAKIDYILKYHNTKITGISYMTYSDQTTVVAVNCADGSVHTYDLSYEQNFKVGREYTYSEKIWYTDTQDVEKRFYRDTVITGYVDKIIGYDTDSIRTYKYVDWVCVDKYQRASDGAYAIKVYVAKSNCCYWFKTTKEVYDRHHPNRYASFYQQTTNKYEVIKYDEIGQLYEMYRSVCGFESDNIRRYATNCVSSVETR